MFKRKKTSMLVTSTLLLNSTVLYANIVTDSNARTEVPRNIVADPNAGINNKPSVSKTQNLTPIVNIVNPNANGLSHNKFTQFDVGKKGVILNNSLKITSTKLAGAIAPNTNLNSNARSILNEVNSLDKSKLNGFIEVGGQKADVFIVNPNGIAVNGSGFINTSNVILSTGHPTFSNGALTGFNVNTGTISFTGANFNTTNIEKVQLFSKALSINAKIYAKKISAVTGTNIVNIDGTYTKGSAIESGISIDSTALGGIYAHAITLVSTDKGVGVNLGSIAAAQEQLIIDSNGNITLSKTSSKGTLSLNSTENITVKDTLSAKTITANAGKAITVQQNTAIDTKVIAHDALTFSANTIANNAQLYVGYNPMDMTDTNTTAIGTITAKTFSNTSDILSTATLNFNTKLIAATLDTNSVFTNGGLIKGKTVNANVYTLNNGAIANEGASIYATNSLNLSTHTLNNGVKDNGVKSALGKSVLYSAKTLTTQTAGIFTNKGIVYSVGNMNITGKDGHKNGTLLNDARTGIKATIESKGDMVIKVYTLKNHGKSATKEKKTKTEIVGTTTTKTTSEVSKNDGEPALIVSAKKLNMDIVTGDNAYSLMYSTEDMTLNATTLKNKTLTLITQYKVKKKEWKNWKINDCTNYFFYTQCREKDEYGFKTYEIPTPETQAPSVSYGIRTGGSLKGDIHTLFNGGKSKASYSYYASGTGNTTNTGVNVDIDATAPAVPTSKYGIFIPSTSPIYVVETNDTYTNGSKFIGSDFYLKKMGLWSSKTPVRYGDGNVELELVRQQILKLTGSIKLNEKKGNIAIDGTIYDLATEQGQMISLMQSSLSVKDTLGLKIGVPLTKEQQKKLNKNIFWMEYRVINGKKVLFPKVYLAHGQSQTYLTNGANIIANEDLRLSASGEIYSTGTIRSGKKLELNARTLNNNSGDIKAGDNIAITATNNVTNQNGATIKGKSVSLSSTQGNIVNKTSVTTITKGKNRYESTSKKSTIEATDGNILLNADKDILNAGADIKAKGDIELTTQTGNVQIVAVKTDTARRNGDSRNFARSRNITHTKSGLKADGAINITSAKSVTLQAVDMQSKGDTSVTAKTNILVSALKDVNEYERKTYSKNSNWLSSHTRKTREYRKDETAVGTDINAKNITLKAGDGILLQNTQLRADTVTAESRAIIMDTIKTKNIRESETHTESSTFGGMFGKDSGEGKTKEIENSNGSIIALSKLKNKLSGSTKGISLIAKGAGNSGKGNVSLKNVTMHTANRDLNIDTDGKLEILNEKNVTKTSSFKYKSETNLLKGLNALLLKEGVIQTSKHEGTSTTQETINSSNLIVGGNANIKGGSVTLRSTNLLTAGNANITSTTGSVDITADKANNKKYSYSITKKVAITMDYDTIEAGIKNGFDTGNFSMEVASAKQNKKSQQINEQKHIASTIKSGAGNIHIKSNESIDIKGSKIASATGSTTLNGKTAVNIVNVKDTKTISKKTDDKSMAISVGVSNAYVDAGIAVADANKAEKQVSKAKEALEEHENNMDKVTDQITALKKRLKAGEPGISANDITALQEVHSSLKGETKYYEKGLYLAKANFVTKTVKVLSKLSEAGQSSATYGFKANLTTTGKTTTTNTTETQQKSIGSSVSGENVTITTDNAGKGNVVIKGSSVASKNINIDTGNLSIEAAKTRNTKKSYSKTYQAEMTVSTSVSKSADYSESYSKNNSETTTHTLSQLSGQNINIKTAQDTRVKGGTVIATKDLTVKTGGTLEVSTVTDTQDARFKEQGFSTKGTLRNKNATSNNKKTQQSALIGATVDIVADAVTIDGGIVTAGTFNKNATFDSSNALTLKANSLTLKNKTDTSASKNRGVNVSVPIKSVVTDDTPSGDISYGSERGFSVKRTQNIGTLGLGTITVAGKKADLTGKNRDANTAVKTIFDVKDAGAKSNVAIDTRLLSAKGREQMSNDMQYLNSIIIEEIDLDAFTFVQIAAHAAGSAAAFSVLASSQVPILLGQKDTRAGTYILTTEVTGGKHKNYKGVDFVNIKDSTLYAKMSKAEKNKINAYIKANGYKPIYLGITTLEQGSYSKQNVINGILNTASSAVIGAVDRTYGESIVVTEEQIQIHEIPGKGKEGKTEEVKVKVKVKVVKVVPDKTLTNGQLEVSLLYNPSHGILGDLLEAGLDYTGITTTGMAKQTGIFITQTNANRWNMGGQTRYTFHSQGNLLALSGLQYADNKGLLTRKWSEEKKQVYINMMGSPLKQSWMEDFLEANQKLDKKKVDNFGINLGDVITILHPKIPNVSFDANKPNKGHSRYACSDNPTQESGNTCGYDE